MKVDRDLDKPRVYTTGSGPWNLRPGEDLFWNKEKRKYEVRNAVGGGRSAGRGGPTAEEMAKPPAKKAMGGKVKAYRNGGVTRADGCVSKGHTKGRMV